jgi:hypothetical protein
MRSNRSVSSSLVVAAFVLFTGVSNAYADFVTFVGSGPGGLSASVTFEVSGGNLIVTLTNTSSMDVMASNQVLSGVWFSLPGSLTAVSASVNEGNGSFVNDPTNAGNNAFPDVSGEWAYKSGLNMGFGSNSGISSSGMDDLFGPGDRFSNADLDPPNSPNGINYGITSAGDDPDTANGGLNGEPLVQNSVIFILSGWNGNWSLSDISNVFFQYGTSQNEPRIPGVPEPGVLALLGLGVVGLVFGVRKMSWA